MLSQIKHFMGNNIKILNPGKITAESLKNYLENHKEIESKLPKNRKRIFLTTKDPLEFKNFTEKNMGIKIRMPEKIPNFHSTPTL